MSWTTKEGSSSASGQSPLHFPLSELARREVALTPHDATDVTSCVCFFSDRRSSSAATKGAILGWGSKAVGKPLGEGGVHLFEGFG
jgi:hypothetical protein